MFASYPFGGFQTKKDYYCLLGHMLDSLARTALWDAGLDYLHGTGHGVGAFLNVHEGWFLKICFRACRVLFTSIVISWHGDIEDSAVVQLTYYRPQTTIDFPYTVEPCYLELAYFELLLISK